MLFELPPFDAHFTAEKGRRPRNRLEHRLASGFLEKFAGSRQPVEFDIRKAASLGAVANGVQRLNLEDCPLRAAMGCPDVPGLCLDLA